MTDRVGPTFERLARNLLASQPRIPHEWRPLQDGAGARTDLVCYPGSPDEVWATVRADSVAIGTGEGHEDFEDFGRRRTAAQIASDAVHRLVALLDRRGRDQAV